MNEDDTVTVILQVFQLLRVNNLDIQGYAVEIPRAA
jgi:hypothetical protein